MDKINQIPKEVMELATSPQIYDSCQKIGAKFNLHIDQTAELDSEIRTVLIGKSKPSDFTSHVMERLEINNDLATQITEEVNKEIFQTLRSKIKSTPETQSNTISTLERVGGFSVEPPTNLPGEEESEGEAAKNMESRESMIAGLENPKVESGMTEALKTPPQTSKPNQETRTEPLADHLLSTPTGQPLQKVVQKPSISPQPPQTTKKQGPDSYREPIE